MNERELKYALRDVKAYKGRAWDTTAPVEVYKNLHRDGWSLRQDGLVVAHASAVMLKDVRFVVRKGGWLRAHREGRRNVHAWARGLLAYSGMGTDAREADRLPRVRYSVRYGLFHHDLTRRPVQQRQVKGASVVAFNERGAFGAYFE